MNIPQSLENPSKPSDVSYVSMLTRSLDAVAVAADAEACASREELQHSASSITAIRLHRASTCSEASAAAESSTVGKLAPAQLPGWQATNPGRVARMGKVGSAPSRMSMPRRGRDSKPDAQSDILTPFDLAKKLRGAVQAKDLKTLERLFQRSEVCDMDDRR